MKTFSELWEKYYECNTLNLEKVTRDFRKWDCFDGRFSPPEFLVDDNIYSYDKVEFICTKFNPVPEDIEFIIEDLGKNGSISKPYLPHITFSNCSPKDNPTFFFSTSEEKKIVFLDLRRVDLNDEDTIYMGWEGILRSISEDIYYFLHISDVGVGGSNKLDSLYNLLVKKSKYRSFFLILCIVPSDSWSLRVKFFNKPAPFYSIAQFEYIIYCFYGEDLRIW